MDWTSKIPTMSGYYWLRNPSQGSAALIVEIVGNAVAFPGTEEPDSLDDYRKNADSYLWFGPLKQPR